MAPQGRRQLPATSPLLGFAGPPSRIAASNSTLKCFLGGREHSWMTTTAAVPPSPRPPHHYQAPKAPPCPPGGVRSATNQGRLTHPPAAAPQPSQDGRPATLSPTQPSLRPAQPQVQQPLACRSPPAARLSSPRPRVPPDTSTRLPVTTAVLPSPAPSEEPSPAVATFYETTSPLGGGNPQSIAAPTASSEPNARATGPDTVLARPPSRTTLANGSVGAQGGRDSHPASTSAMTAAPATAAAATSLQTPPTSNDPIFSQGPPNPAYQTAGVAEEHRAKRRRMGDTLLVDATNMLDTYLHVLGGDDLLAGSVELPRFQLLREACQKGDLFFVALHQLFCCWSMNRQVFNTHYAQNEPMVLESAFGLLSSILKSNSTIRQQHLAWLSQFPAPLSSLCRNSEYADTINNVLQFLRCLDRFWNLTNQEHMRLGYPYLVDELVLRYRLYSEVLQTVIFRASRRAMGVPDGAAATRMDSLFHEDMKRRRPTLGGKPLAYPDYLIHPANKALIGSYQEIIRQARNQAPGSPYATAPIISNGFRTQQQQPPHPERPYSHQQQSTYLLRHLLPAYQQPHAPSAQQLHVGQHQHQQPSQARPIQQHTTISPSTHFIPQFSTGAASPTGAPQQANGPSTSSLSNCVPFARPANGNHAPMENYTGYLSSPSSQSQRPVNGNSQPPYASPLQSPTVNQTQSGPVHHAQGFRQHTQTIPQQFQRNPVLGRPSLQPRPGTVSLSPQLQHLPVASPRMPNGGASPVNPSGGFRPPQLPPQDRSSPIYPPQQRAPPTDLNTTMAPSPTMNFRPYLPMAPARQPNMTQQQPGQPFVYTGGAGAGIAGQTRRGNVRARTTAEDRVHASNLAAVPPGNNSSVPRMIPPIQVADYPHDPYERKSLASSLHQVDIRSPPRQPHQTVSRGAERHYQYIQYLALGPAAIPPQGPLYNFSFNVPEEVCAMVSKTECPADGLPVNMFSDKSKRIRLRCVFRPKTERRFVEGDWAVADTQWPEHIFIQLNQRTLTIRRKQQHAKDQPIEIGHYIKAGANALNIWSTDGQGKANKSLVPFIAVEVIETLSHSSIMSLPNLAANAVIPAADTVAIIKRRLAGTCGNGGDDDDDEIAMVVSDLTVNLADPFSFCIFEVPVRGKDCTHLECFDLETWLNTRPAKKSCSCGSQLSNCSVCPKEPSFVDKWKCPLCSGDARPQSLRIDGFLQQVREALVTQNKLRTKEIMVSADGSWRPKTEPTDDQSDDDSDAEAPLAAARSRSTTRPSEQRTPVIELD